MKVLDFGLAKMEEPASSEEEQARTARPRTEEGTIVGTTAYMSPEQAEGKPVDARSDIFSFGAVLYEMLTGRRAFRGDTQAFDSLRDPEGRAGAGQFDPQRDSA